jgi:molybdate transport system substrate-binding protein
MKRAAVAAAAAVLLAGCGASAGTTPADGRLHGAITVDAASSLEEAFTTIKQQFEAAHPGTTITLSFGASSDFATQISQGAPVDVFASASTKNMAQVGTAARDPKDFVANTAEIAVPPSNPAHITSVRDLARPGVKVAVCAAAVPCGVLATEVFRKAKISVHPTASLADVKTTLATVESGEVDAGIVYVTDVRAAKGKVTGVRIPAAIDAKTVYPIAALRAARNPALAQAFVAYVLSAAGARVLHAAGFTAP